jgi:metallopeptidase MepB
MNFAKSRPSLLKDEDIRRLFHELGHGVHNLLSRTKYSRFHGTQVDRDFSEIPSMVLENFFWVPENMRALALHYSRISPEYEEIWRQSLPASEVNRPLPDELPNETIVALIATKQNNSALTNLIKLNHSMYDMLVHSPASLDALKEMDQAETFNKLREEIVGLKGGEAIGDGYGWANGQVTFRAPVTGYDAGYYTYLL